MNRDEEQGAGSGVPCSLSIISASALHEMLGNQLDGLELKKYFCFALKTAE